ncbi:hypothetical protein RRG08_025458 [Elysia crispata]|uniref:Fucolectin tachylectin-4 pentraxin-1 domain-containing protein n=1 Tax=Elysia crispata TaxID=231223 RepID=A0AAE0YC68_9GAST|nr:hypothetical protein RRG08_025458 [Elysia crispata]
MCLRRRMCKLLGVFPCLDQPKYSKLDRPHVPIVDNSQDCVAISPGFRDGRWIDELCEIFVTHPFICEKFPGPSPCLDPDREGWFGHNCRHKCQCDQSANCNKFDGSCARRCAPNRIGPSCQYELMRFSVDPSFAWLRDKSRATCNNEGLDSVRLTLDTAVHVNSIHLDLNDSNQLQNIEVIVNKLSHEYQQECTASGITTLVCNINDVIKEVKLSGSGVRHLCNYQIFEANVNFQVLNKTEAEIAWLNDRYAAATCNDEDKEVLDVTFDRPRKLSWITFYFNESDSLKNRSMSITSGATAQSFTHQCENPIISESRTLVDVYCPTDHLVNQLYLRGPGVALLCGIRFDNVRVEYSSDGVSSSRFSWLTDYNDKTCNHIDDDVVTVTLDTPIPLTWIRVVLKTETLDRIELRYKTMSSETHVQVCPYAHFAQVSFETFELHCQTPDLVSHLRLVGPAVKDLCSLYISQGRNVALKEAARESSTVNARHTDPSFAVDGLEENGTAVLTSDVSMCALTAIDTPSWWMVTLSLEAYVHSFKISHQGNDNMRGFSIVFVSNTGEQYTYTDNSGPPRPVYTVIPSPKISFKVQTVKIKAREGQPVSLCEVSILGETVCPDGQFGLRCEWACNCLHNFSCLPHSGGCPRGCARGFHGEDCYQPILY